MAVTGFGLQVYYGDTSPASTEIAQIVDATPPVREVNDIDTYHHGSTSGVGTYMAGKVEPGEFEFTAVYVPATFVTLSGLIKTQKHWMIEFSDNSDVKFEGYIKSDGIVAPLDDMMTMTFTVKVTGPITVSAS